MSYLYYDMYFAEPYLAKHQFTAAINEPPDNGLMICVVIPAYNEPDLLTTLDALWKCRRPAASAEIIVVVNSPVNAGPLAINRNQQTVHEAGLWIACHNDPRLRFFLIHRPGLPEKSAGVGMARKIGMDEAVCRFMRVDNKAGIISSFDADSICDANYLTEVEAHFKQNPVPDGASIYFEHPLTAGDTHTNQGITLYELHLRYMNQALRYTGYPYSYHTIGSAMAVTMESYVRQGGMNKRKAGEDFYFLQKIIEQGNFSEINSTRIIPSARVSDRVPFGTGASMKQWQRENRMDTYTLQAYEDIREFVATAGLWYDAGQPITLDNVAVPLREYLQAIHFSEELRSIRSNCASPQTFRKRFFRWFNPFRVIKYLNFSHRKYYSKAEIFEEANQLRLKLGFYQEIPNAEAMLKFYRDLDRNGYGLRKTGGSL